MMPQGQGLDAPECHSGNPAKVIGRRELRA